STYADREHDSIEGTEGKLGEIVRRVAARGGKVIIPSFAIGRTQELVYALHGLWRAGKIPRLPIYIDSPLAVDITQVFRLHPELFDRREPLVERAGRLFDFELVTYVREAAESIKLNSLAGPAVIIAASGMAEAGRITHHLINQAGNDRNLILFVGFQADHTLGRRIQEGQKEVRILGKDVTVRAEVATLGGYSAHADKNELRKWVRQVGGPIKRAFVVHGENPARAAMAEILKSEGVGEVVLPELGQSFKLP
ncbi:MAG: MBL fold metallo-hydrolase RNA specificity domain-containing protein, partial [Gemmatimonadales bacterium]